MNARLLLAGIGMPIALAAAGCSDASSGIETPAPDYGEVVPVSEDWKLVWSDEFDGSELDRTKWTPEESCWGGGNNEHQCYTDRTENVAVEDGFLYLKARKERWTGPDRPPEIAADPNPQVTQEYTSGKVRTKGLASWKYGRFEARAKVPAGQGLWTAIWMMSEDNEYGGWPLSGEIDIMETVNIGAKCDECPGSDVENRTVSALHFGDVPPDNVYLDKKTPIPGGTLPSENFHVYAVEWGEGLMRFFVDDRLHFTLTQDDWYTGSELAGDDPSKPFDKPFYIMANLAVGGAWPERDNETGLAESSVPSELVIDWVRVFECEPDPETARKCMGGGD